MALKVQKLNRDLNSCDGVKIFIGGKATTSILEARQLSKAIPLPKAQEVVKELLELSIKLKS